MSNADALFQPHPQVDDDATAVAESVRCIEAFTSRFNARDLAGMDELLHFPHIILSGEHLVVWSEPGNLPVSFFDDLERDTGWAESRYQRKDAVLVSPRKVHLVVEYTRNRADGSVASSHTNLWVVTFDGGRWGIKQRSY
jgi:hypothetical protein